MVDGLFNGAIYIADVTHTRYKRGTVFFKTIYLVDRIKCQKGFGLFGVTRSKQMFNTEDGGRRFLRNVGYIYQTTRRHFPEDRNIYFHRLENLRRRRTCFPTRQPDSATVF